MKGASSFCFRSAGLWHHVFATLRLRPRIARSERGAVAQLGERMNRTHEVRGSIPLSSTEPA